MNPSYPPHLHDTGRLPTHQQWVPAAQHAAFTASSTAAVGRWTLRVGDVERAAVCDALSVHFAEGRLTPDELDSRLGAATTATTRADLRLLLADLPSDADLTDSGVATGRSLAPPPAPGRTPSPARRGPSAIDVLVGLGVVGSALIIVMMLAGLGMVSPPFFLASVFGGFLALAVGAGTTHLLYRMHQPR